MTDIPRRLSLTLMTREQLAWDSACRTAAIYLLMTCSRERRRLLRAEMCVQALLHRARNARASRPE